jgi:hypothetical protein
MALLVNGAGSSAADPILHGLRAQFVFATSSFDVSTVTNAWMDQAAGFPGTSSVSGSLTPTTATIISGVAGSYGDTPDELTIGDTTGLAADDAIYLSHASITDGIYLLASVVDGTKVTLQNDPFAGGGDQTGISYQVGWSFIEDIGTAPISSDGTGVQNYFKARVEDGSANQTDAFDTFYARTAPAGSAYIALDGLTYTGQTFSDAVLTLSILSGWTNNGGISHVALANHSVQSVNNFTWTSGGGTAERTLASAESSGITASGGDGAKYGAFEFKAKASGQALSVDFDLTVDTAGPVLVLTAFGA